MDDATTCSGAVDTAIPGTPEVFWTHLDAPPWSPPAGPLVVLAPHPDDETLGAGGLMYTWATVCHLPVTIVSVTDGEAACPEVPDLKAVRRRELEAARRDLARTGIDIVHLEIPDGQVEQHRDRVLEALERIAPEGVTVIAPFEHDQHADHDACGLAARQLARLRRVTLAQYPIWAWHQATPAIFSERRLGRFMLSEAAREAKQTAIQRFASQLRDRPGGPIVPPTVLEHFNRAYEMFVLQ